MTLDNTLVEEYIYYLNDNSFNYNRYGVDEYSFEYNDNKFNCLSGYCNSDDDMHDKYSNFLDNLNSILK